MTNVTISVPSDLKDKLDQYSEINWSEVARKAWKEKLDKLELLDRLTINSTASDAEIEELSKKIKHGMALAHDRRAKELSKAKA
ncbi:MAG: hypothetical protein ABH863_06005 [Candidatus Micrarchaeota archaeon]